MDQIARPHGTHHYEELISRYRSVRLFLPKLLELPFEGQFTGFHAIVVPGTIRDSLYVLDGLLEHETGQTLCPDCAQVGEALNVCGLGPESLRELFDTLRVIGPAEVKSEDGGASRSGGADGYAGSVATQLTEWPLSSLLISAESLGAPGGALTCRRSVSGVENAPLRRSGGAESPVGS